MLVFPHLGKSLFGLATADHFASACHTKNCNLAFHFEVLVLLVKCFVLKGCFLGGTISSDLKVLHEI